MRRLGTKGPHSRGKPALKSWWAAQEEQEWKSQTVQQARAATAHCPGGYGGAGWKQDHGQAAFPKF